MRKKGDFLLLFFSFLHLLRHRFSERKSKEDRRERESKNVRGRNGTRQGREGEMILFLDVITFFFP